MEDFMDFADGLGHRGIGFVSLADASTIMGQLGSPAAREIGLVIVSTASAVASRSHHS